MKKHHILLLAITSILSAATFLLEPETLAPATTEASACHDISYDNYDKPSICYCDDGTTYDECWTYIEDGRWKCNVGQGLGCRTNCSGCSCKIDVCCNPGDLCMW